VIIEKSLSGYEKTKTYIIKNKTKEAFMKINIVYKKEKEWFIRHIQEYPDYESQGKTVDELKENLIEIYNDINKGLVPDAEPFQLLEVAI
jgi:predicted RNase H-like HicB family nuclease